VKKEEYFNTACKYLEKAIALYPRTNNGLVLYGNAMALYKKDYKKAIEQYLKVLDYDPYDNHAFDNTLNVLGSIDNGQETQYKLRVLNRLFSVNSNNALVNYNIGKIYGQFKGNLDSACYFLERSVNLAPDNLAGYKDLGIVYSMKGDYTKALAVFSKAQSLDPNDQQIRQNIMLTHQIMAKQMK
jgi:tetratricopeptide (TPR) repeat protein